MLAAAILKAMKNKQTEQEEPTNSNTANIESNEGTDSPVKDVSLQSTPNSNIDGAPKRMSTFLKARFKLLESPERRQSEQNISNENTESNSQPTTAPRKYSMDTRDSPLSVVTSSPGLSNQKSQFERERPNNIITMFKRGLDVDSENPSRTNSPGLKATPFKRSAVATMKRAREKIQITRLLTNLGRRPSLGGSSQQVQFIEFADRYNILC